MVTNIEVINNTESINPTTQPIPILDKNLNDFNLSELLPDINPFKEFTKSS